MTDMKPASPMKNDGGESGVSKRLDSEKGDKPSPLPSPKSQDEVFRNVVEFMDKYFPKDSPHIMVCMNYKDYKQYMWKKNKRLFTS